VKIVLVNGTMRDPIAGEVKTPPESRMTTNLRRWSRRVKKRSRCSKGDDEPVKKRKKKKKLQPEVEQSDDDESVEKKKSKKSKKLKKPKRSRAKSWKRRVKETVASR